MKPGYKQTDLGVLPEEWEVQPLNEISPRIQVGLVINPSHYFEKNGTVPMITAKNVSPHVVSTEETNKISAASNEVLKSTQIHTNDVVIVRVGYPGTAAVVSKEQNGINCASLIIVRSGKFNSDFLCYCINSEIGQSQVELASYGSAQKCFNIGDAVKMLIPFPPPAEQQAIAEALGAIDTLLTAQRGLLAKKRDLKQATQQALLSGETRLPGFAGEWEVKTFGDVMTGFSSGATPYRENKHFYQGSIKWVSSGELNYNIITDTIEHISAEAMRKTNLRLLPAGTFLMAITGLEAAGTRGSCAILGTEATTNQSCMALFPGKELITEYLFHYYVLHGDALAFQYCQGTKQQSYTGTIVKRLPILLPPVDEQRAIAAILSDMDVELEALAAQVAKTQALKQGMMQDLLTGAVRLAPAAAAPSTTLPPSTAA